MKELDKLEMLKVDGGIDISGALIETLLKTSEFYYNIGRSLGSSIRKSLGHTKLMY
jgi:hypothetical protein